MHDDCGSAGRYYVLGKPKTRLSPIGLAKVEEQRGGCVDDARCDARGEVRWVGCNYSMSSVVVGVIFPVISFFTCSSSHPPPLPAGCVSPGNNFIPPFSEFYSMTFPRGKQHVVFVQCLSGIFVVRLLNKCCKVSFGRKLMISFLSFCCRSGEIQGRSWDAASPASSFFDALAEADGGGDHDCVHAACWAAAAAGAEGGGSGEEGCCCGEGEEENSFGAGTERLLDGWGAWGRGGGKGVYNRIGLGCCGGSILVVGSRGCFRVGLVEVEVDG